MHKHADADYHLIQFRGTTALLEQLDHNLKITDGVLRFRIIKLRPGTPAPPDLRPAAMAAAAAGAHARVRSRTGLARRPLVSQHPPIVTASRRLATRLRTNRPNLRYRGGYGRTHA